MAREKGTGNLQREKSGRYTVRVCIDGKRFSRSTGTRDHTLAEQYLERMLAPLGLGAHKILLNEAWRHYVSSPERRELALTTLEAKRLVFFHFTRWIDLHHPIATQLAHVSTEMISEYLAAIRPNIAASTYNCRVCILREIFHVLSRDAGLPNDPWQRIHLLTDDSHARRELALDELKSVLSAAESRGSDWHLMFAIGVYTGLRLGDCCLLEWTSVLLDRGIIQLIPHKTRKYARGVPITIPIHPALAELLGKITDRDHSPYVLPSIAEMYLSHRWSVASVTGEIFRSAGIRTSIMLEGRKRLTPDATFHSLRHTFVSLSANAGVPLPVLQSIVGHTSTAMTRHYYHANEEALRRAVNAIPKL